MDAGGVVRDAPVLVSLVGQSMIRRKALVEEALGLGTRSGLSMKIREVRLDACSGDTESESCPSIIGQDLLEELSGACSVTARKLRDCRRVQRPRVLRKEACRVAGLLQRLVVAAVVQVEPDQVSVCLAQVGLELHCPFQPALGLRRVGQCIKDGTDAAQGNWVFRVELRRAERIDD